MLLAEKKFYQKFSKSLEEFRVHNFITDRIATVTHFESANVQFPGIMHKEVHTAIFFIWVLHK